MRMRKGMPSLRSIRGRMNMRRSLFGTAKASPDISRGLSGYPVYAGYGSATHFYLQQTGGLPAEAEGFVDIGDYLAMRLTGNAERRVNESMAAGFGCFDRKKGRFDFDSLKKAGADVRFLPGDLLLEGAGGFLQRKTGFSCAWGQSGQLSGCREKPGRRRRHQCGNRLSGIGFFLKNFSGRRKNTASIYARFPGGGYLYVGASLNGGKVYERLAAFFSETCRLFTGSTPDVYEKMRKIAGGKEETDLKACPDLYGTRGGGEETGRSGFWADRIQFPPCRSDPQLCARNGGRAEEPV